MEWYEVALRVLVILGFACAAYDGYRRARAQGTWSGPATAIITLLLLAYLTGGVALLVWYGALIAPEYPLLVATIGAVYLAGGLYLLIKAIRAVQRRFPPRRPH